jgi:hypothetical protein
MRVFIGPTGVGLDLSGLNVFPPAQQGDITATVFSGEKTIVLIDGYFTQHLAPFHKELIFAVSQGVRVIGAGSLGAIRAAECERYGVEAVGVIANWYKHGICTDDSDVALLHGPGEDGYKPLTVPLVNIIATAHEMKRLGIIQNTDDVVCPLSKIHYTDRSWFAIKQAHIPSFADFSLLYIDQKALDAKEAIDASNQAINIEYDTPANVLNDCMVALMLNDVPANDGKRPWEKATLRDDALNFWLIAEMASSLGMRATKEEVFEQSKAMWVGLGVISEEKAQKWMIDNRVTESQWNVFASKRALVQKSKDWFNSVSKASQLVPMTLEYQLFNGK